MVGGEVEVLTGTFPPSSSSTDRPWLTSEYSEAFKHLFAKSTETLHLLHFLSLRSEGSNQFCLNKILLLEKGQVEAEQ